MRFDGMDDSRLDRIEEKIDKLSDAMVSLARTEEKILSIEMHNRNTQERLNSHSDKISKLTDRVADNERTVILINKVSWVVLVAVIGTIVKMWMM